TGLGWTAMFRRPSFLLLALRGLTFCALVATAFAATPIRHTLRFSDAAAHYLDVDAVFPTDGAASITVFMPVWTPGSYLVREYARNIVTLSASDPAGKTLSTEKSAKNRWQIQTGGADAVHVSYRLYCREINVRGNWVERDFAMINGAPTFLALVD